MAKNVTHNAFFSPTGIVAAIAVCMAGATAVAIAMKPAPKPATKISARIADVPALKADREQAPPRVIRVIPIVKPAKPDPAPPPEPPQMVSDIAAPPSAPPPPTVLPIAPPPIAAPPPRHEAGDICARHGLHREDYMAGRRAMWRCAPNRR